ncbi:MAG: hypothetical protein IPJ43_19145 [Saprospiraceae bacterium]|nr:hypothetical protein [Saprospiraceae bacterium]
MVVFLTIPKSYLHFGYDERVEISDKNKRKKFDLPKRFKMPLLDDNDLATRKNNYITDDADWVEVNTTISTSSDQIAIALWKSNQDMG